MRPTRILEVAELDFAYEPTRWAFAENEAAGIASHWTQLRQKKPALYNGRVLLLGRRKLMPRADGELRLSGAFFETDYADYLAWRAFGHPGEPVDNCFSMAAHTFNAGQIYFPAGTPDPTDVFDGTVDLDASARRELLEETGVTAAEAAIRRGWTVVFARQRVACMKLMTLSIVADEAKARIEAFLARDPHAELTRIHVVRSPDDIDEARTPAFVAAYLRQALS